MGASSSIVNNSIQSVNYAPPDLFTFNDHNSHNYNLSTTRKTSSTKSRRRKFILSPASSFGRQSSSAISGSFSDYDKQVLQDLLSTPQNQSSHNPSDHHQQTPQKNELELKKLLKSTFKNFFYLKSLTELQLNLLLKVIKFQTYKPNEVIFSQGDQGSTLFIIDRGEVEVLIDGRVVRKLTSGQIFGELGLLFNTPRSATIRCPPSPSSGTGTGTGGCSVYLLERDLYKTIQKITNSASILQRNRWLLSCSEFSSFTPIHMSRLFSTLRHMRFQKNEFLFEENKECDFVLLIERGRALVTMYPQQLLLEDETEEAGHGERSSRRQRQRQRTGREIEQLLGIIRPQGLAEGLVDDQSSAQFLSSFYHRAASTTLASDSDSGEKQQKGRVGVKEEKETKGGDGAWDREREEGEGEEREWDGGDESKDEEGRDAEEQAEAMSRSKADSSVIAKKYLSKYITREDSLPPSPSPYSASLPHSALAVEMEVLHEGCIIGLPVLHASSNRRDEKSWKYISSSCILPAHVPIIRRSSTLHSQQSFGIREEGMPSSARRGSDASVSSAGGAAGGGSTRIPTPQKTSAKAAVGTAGGGTAAGTRTGYVISPISVIALTDLQCSIFTVAAFERAFGSFSTSSATAASGGTSGGASDASGLSSDSLVSRLSFNNSNPYASATRPSQFAYTLQTIPSQASTSSKDIINSPSNHTTLPRDAHSNSNLGTMNPNYFYYKRILGQGGFGTVLLGTYNPPLSSHATSSSGHHTSLPVTSDPHLTYAIKVMSKDEIVSKGQVSHVLDEAQILSSFSSPFILHLYATFQTKDWIALVTDVCELGDLWSVLYETEVFQETGEDCLPLELIQFYLTGIVSGLDHMHASQVIFRDLKPENILIDKRGYVKLIDCGLAKRLPYLECHHRGNGNGEEDDFLRIDETVIYKTYSLCGTPGNLLPSPYLVLLSYRFALCYLSLILPHLLYHFLTAPPLRCF
jgi:hypothetical protein